MFEITNLNQFTLLSTIFFIYIKAISDVPIYVMFQYSHKSVIAPESNSGANEDAGFMDDPIERLKKTYNPTILSNRDTAESSQ